MASSRPRPPTQRWTVHWWVSTGRGPGDAATVIFNGELDARQAARDYTHNARQWPRAHVRLAEETRRVSLVQTERGERWECSRWQQATDPDTQRPIVEAWNHDATTGRVHQDGDPLDGAQPPLPVEEAAHSG